MKITVITISYNSDKYIEQTIKSVLNQTYDDFEYIIVDGNSSDNTVNIIKKYSDRLTFISESDKGIYNAMNKGLKMATGDAISFLNSDDFFADSNVLSDVCAFFEKNKTDAVFANLKIVDELDTSKLIRFYKSDIFTLKKLKFGVMPPHPSMFIKSKLFRSFGGFDEEFKLSSDFELVTRFFYKYRASFSYFDRIVSIMRNGGVSNKVVNKHRITLEDLKGARKNGIKTNYFMISLRFILKLSQFLNKTK